MVTQDDPESSPPRTPDPRLAAQETSHREKGAGNQVQVTEGMSSHMRNPRAGTVLRDQERTPLHRSAEEKPWFQQTSEM